VVIHQQRGENVKAQVPENDGESARRLAGKMVVWPRKKRDRDRVRSLVQVTKVHKGEIKAGDIIRVYTLLRSPDDALGRLAKGNRFVFMLRPYRDDFIDATSGHGQREILTLSADEHYVLDASSAWKPYQAFMDDLRWVLKDPKLPSHHGPWVQTADARKIAHDRLAEEGIDLDNLRLENIPLLRFSYGMVGLAYPKEPVHKFIWNPIKALDPKYGEQLVCFVSARTSECHLQKAPEATPARAETTCRLFLASAPWLAGSYGRCFDYVSTSQVSDPGQSFVFRVECPEANLKPLLVTVHDGTRVSTCESAWIDEDQEARDASPPHDNEFGVPVVYWPRRNPSPLSNVQIRQVLDTVEQQQVDKDVWFLFVLASGQNWARINAYHVPDVQTHRIRRGKGLCIERNRVIESFDYAQVSERHSPFRPAMDPPLHYRLLPFQDAGPDRCGDEKLVELVDFIRSAPDVPGPRVENSSGSRIMYRPLDTSDPIYAIRRAGAKFGIQMGMVEGGLSGFLKKYVCTKQSGIWKVVSHEGTVIL